MPPRLPHVTVQSRCQPVVGVAGGVGRQSVRTQARQGVHKVEEQPGGRADTGAQGEPQLPVLSWLRAATPQRIQGLCY